MGGRGILRGWGDDRIGYAWLHKESYAYPPARKIAIVRRSLGLGRFRTACWLYPEPGKSEMLHNLNRRGISWVFVLWTLRSMVRFLATPDAKSAVGKIVSLLAVVDIIAMMRWRGWNLPLEDQLGQDGKQCKDYSFFPDLEVRMLVPYIVARDGILLSSIPTLGALGKVTNDAHLFKDKTVQFTDADLRNLGHGKSADTLVFGFGRTETLSKPRARCKTYENSVSLRGDWIDEAYSFPARVMKVHHQILSLKPRVK